MDAKGTWALVLSAQFFYERKTLKNSLFFKKVLELGSGDG